MNEHTRDQPTIFRINPYPAEPRYILFKNSVVPDRMASREAIRPGSTLFSILLINTHRLTGKNLRTCSTRVSQK